MKTGNGAKTETYVHDDNANVISQDVGGTAATYSYDRNRLLTATADGATASYRYDPFGRQTSVVSAGLTISRTTYDGFDHIAESEKMNDAGALESTTYAYDPLDRTASKIADGETTDYTYLGLSSEVLGEEVAGQLTKSYQYSPWGQRLSQITHQADPEAGVEAGESAYYGYNSHTDVETLTDDSGSTVATYGYTAYGNTDEAEYTGIDKPEAGTPEDSEPYNAYRYNSKRWDASSGTYDMGFRDYAPGLNRFTTRDMYNGALSNMSLGSDPYTSNRYAFGAGNPISMIEMDGHLPCKEGVRAVCGDSVLNSLGANVAGATSEESAPAERSNLSAYDARVESGNIPSAVPWYLTQEGWGDVLVMGTVNFGIDTVHAFEDPMLFFEFWGGPQGWMDQVELELVGIAATFATGGLGAGTKMAVGGASRFVRGTARGSTSLAANSVDDVARAVPDPPAQYKSSGARNRKSAVYVNVLAPDGPQVVGSRPGGIHAEDAADELFPGAQLSRPFGWRSNGAGEITWQPIPVCVICQPKYPPTRFPVGTDGDPGGAWGR